MARCAEAWVYASLTHNRGFCFRIMVLMTLGRLDLVQYRGKSHQAADTPLRWSRQHNPSRCPLCHETQKSAESCVWWQQKRDFPGFLATKRKSKSEIASGGRHKAAGAAPG